MRAHRHLHTTPVGSCLFSNYPIFGNVVAATNALIAVWTVCLSPLVKSCIRHLDCTENQVNGKLTSTLDIMPEIECWPEESVFVDEDGVLHNAFWFVFPLASFLFFIYAVAVPAILLGQLFVALRIEAERIAQLKAHLQGLSVRKLHRMAENLGITEDTLDDVEAMANDKSVEKAQVISLMLAMLAPSDPDAACESHLRDRFPGEFVRSHGWLLLRYKPARWWFEFPLCLYKIVIITSSQLLDSESTAYELLYILVFFTASLLILVVADCPYRDSLGTEGWTQADKLQVLVLTGQMINYGVGFWCLNQQRERKILGYEPNDEGSYLNWKEETLVGVAAVLFTLGPILPPWIGIYYERKAHKERRLRAIESGELNPLDGASKLKKLHHKAKKRKNKTESDDDEEASEYFDNPLGDDDVDDGKQEGKGGGKAKQKQGAGSAEPSGPGGKAGKSKSSDSKEKGGGKAKKKRIKSDDSAVYSNPLD